MINFFDVVSEDISFIETNTYSSCEALSDQEMKALRFNYLWWLVLIF